MVSTEGFAGGFVARSAVAVLELSGADRHRFLNGQLTCEVAGLETGQGIYGFFTDIKGRVQGDATVLALEDRLWLEVPAERLAALAAHLGKYILADRVEVTPREDLATVTVAGAGPLEALEREAGTLPAGFWSHREATVGGVPVHVVRAGQLGVEGVALWCDAAARGTVEKALEGIGVPPLALEALEAARIAAGIPRFGVDFGPENFPQETGVEAAISYTKGCYLGQEVVARLHYRGQVSRQLRRLEGDGEGPLEAGQEVLYEGRSAGTVTSAAGPPQRATPIALAMVQRRAFEPGTRLQVSGGGSAVVLPVE
jgi:aminomethyltransferase